MDVLLQADDYGDWPDEAERMYQRVEVLGQGSYGVVWMAKRVQPPKDEYDDEYVALKNIEIKEAKGRIFAEREIKILTELHHPHVIQLIRSFPVHRSHFRLVALQLARGPNLNYLVQKRGALGLPLARLVSRQLISAVSYLHGRAVLHRDIKPTNCILENTQLSPIELYDWIADNTIWSDGEDAEECVKQNKWKLMLIDFGFARALDKTEVEEQEPTKRMRNSIVFERKSGDKQSLDGKEDADDDDKKKDDAKAIQEANEEMRKNTIEHSQDPEPVLVALGDGPGKRKSAISTLEKVEISDDDLDFVDNDGSIGSEDDGKLERFLTKQHESMYGKNGGNTEATDTAPKKGKRFTRTKSADSNDPPGPGGRRNRRGRLSTARTQLRSMSALGTKAYAAPEIKDLLRKKTAADFEKNNAALTECVADYGMIVDAYSVGWTLRVILTGVPPQCTISTYLTKIEERREDRYKKTTYCCCFHGKPEFIPGIRVRDTSDLPLNATLFLTALTKVNPEDRMTVREAQNHPWIKGEGDETYELPQGDFPSSHGDPVVPLECAESLSRIVEAHHDS